MFCSMTVADSGVITLPFKGIKPIADRVCNFVSFIS
uniref:Uncharacterized protein n=1 Tax=Solanum lycopersicum TaxID=4081 RepID=A0A3Q7EA03_SOLLC